MPSLSAFALAYCALVLLAAYSLRSAVGFGGGLVAIPLLALALPMAVVVPLVTLLGLAQSIGHALGSWRFVSWRALFKLMPSTLAGVALGLFLFRALDPQILTKGLGGFVIAYALYALLASRRLPPLPPGVARFAVLPLGTGAGLIATLFGGMAGPLYVVYLDLIQLDKSRFRATIQAILLALAATRLAGYWGIGILDWSALTAFAAGFPVMLLGMAIGNRLHARVDQSTFAGTVRVLLIGSGIALLMK